MNTTLTDRLTAKLAWIDAQLAVCDAATAGPWVNGRTSYDIPAVFHDSTSAIATFGTYRKGDAPYFLHNHSANATFISSARTVCPKALHELRTALLTLEKILKAGEGNTVWADTPSARDARMALLSILETNP